MTHFFITGHTGFKGSWLTLLLTEMGHQVTGYSLEPISGGLFQMGNIENVLIKHYVGDIRDKIKLHNALTSCRPDVAIHLAAQPLVLRSFADPIETYTTTVDGTRNFLEAVSACEEPPISLVITTDKVYRDDGKAAYIETDPLGGHDPYSASKAMADIMTKSWAETHNHMKILIARAGNVIGAYDVNENRLIPDYVRAFKHQKILTLRNPNSIRPWQHVLDCLSGYLHFLDFASKHDKFPIELNFGPDPENSKTVSEVITEAAKTFPLKVEVSANYKAFRKETAILALDPSKAKAALGWRNKLDFETAIQWSLEELNSIGARDLAVSQIRKFLQL